MMQSLWRWFISVLVWLSSDPDAMNAESPKAAAAVAVAYASLAPEPDPEPKPPRPVGPVSTPQCTTGTCQLR